MPAPHERPEYSTKSLLERARAGDSRALSQLFRVQGERLRGWARRRWPSWARRAGDTRDLMQDAILHTLQRLDRFEHRGKGALQAYLRRAVLNRIADELREIARRPTQGGLDAETGQMPAPGRSPLDAAAHAEWLQRYKLTLKGMSADEQTLVVGRLELGYSYEQLALTTGRATPGAARVAARRAVAKLADHMAAARRPPVPASRV